MNDMVSDWLLASLFWIGAALFLLGLALVVAPVRVMTLAKSMDRWVATHDFFEAVNAPRYQESVIYRHHRLAGALIVLAALATIYMFAFYTTTEVILAGIESITNTLFGEWLLTNLYYLLLVLNVIALVIGVIVFLRPSLLKRLEAWGNRWIDTEAKLEGLNREHHIPENILPGRPRWFGLFVLLGSAYIMYMLRGVVL